MVTVKVFISSAISELQEEREIAGRAVAELDLEPNRFEAWPASPEKALEKALSEVKDSEIFILILGSEVSDPVIAEYEAARDSIPDRILVFVKRVQRSPQAEEFLKRIGQECVYKNYRNAHRLGPLVQKAIRSLMRGLLKRRDESDLEVLEEALVDETVTLGPQENYLWKFELEEDDLLSGIVDEVDGDLIDIFLMDRKNYVKRKNDRAFKYHGEERIGAYDIDIQVDEGGTWYLLIENPARVYDREVRVEVNRLYLG